MTSLQESRVKAVKGIGSWFKSEETCIHEGWKKALCIALSRYNKIPQGITCPVEF